MIRARADGAVTVLETVVRRLAAQRQRTAQRGHALEVAPRLDLFGEQPAAGWSLRRDVFRAGRARGGGEFGGGLQFVHGARIVVVEGGSCLVNTTCVASGVVARSVQA